MEILDNTLGEAQERISNKLEGRKKSLGTAQSGKRRRKEFSLLDLRDALKQPNMCVLGFLTMRTE